MQTGKNIQELEKIIADQDIEIKVLKKIISTLKTDSNAQKIESLRIQLRKQYEAACEQLYLFDDFETSSVIGALEETPSDVEIEVSSYIRRKDIQRNLHSTDITGKNTVCCSFHVTSICMC